MKSSMFVLLLTVAAVRAAGAGDPPPHHCLDFPDEVPCPLPGDELVIATVNGVAITGVDLRFVSPSGSHRAEIPAHQASGDEIERALLEDAIDAELLYQTAVRLGALDDREVCHRLMVMMEGQAFVKPAIAMEIADDELRAYRETHPEEFLLVAYRHVQHRAFLISDQCSEEDARREAEAFRAAFPADRRAFEESLRQETRCSSPGLEGAYLVLRSGEPDASGLAEVAWGLEDEQVSEVVRLDDGYHVLKLIGGNERREITLENGRQRVRSALVESLIREWRAEAATVPRTWFDIAVDEEVLERYRVGEGLPTDVVARVSDLEITTEDLDLELMRLKSRWEKQGRAPGEEEIRAELEVQIDQWVLYLAGRDEFLSEREQARSVVRGWTWERELVSAPCVEPSGGFSEEELRQQYEAHRLRFGFTRRVIVDRMKIVADAGEDGGELRRRADQRRQSLGPILDGIWPPDVARLDPLYEGGSRVVWSCDGRCLELVRLGDEEFEAALGLEEGEVSELIEVEGGFVAMRAVLAGDAQWLPFEEYLARARESLVRGICEVAYREQVYEPYLQTLRERAEIEIDEEALEQYEVLPWPPCCGEGCGHLR